MFIKCLKLENFRNLHNSTIIPSEDINVIFGENGMGKTNLIEAVWIASGRKSFRSVKDSNLIKIENGEKLNFAKIECEFYGQNRNQSSKITLGNKKSAVLNEVVLDSVSKLKENIHAVVFSPVDLELIENSPKERRNWLDETISAIRPKYEKVLKLYRKCLDQRNAVLKNYQNDKISADILLDVYDKHLSQYGEFLIKQRKLYLKAVEQLIPEIFEGLTRSRETLTFSYECSCKDGTAEDILSCLNVSRETDVKYQNTTVGAHRDDVDFQINSMSVKTFASQGQKRSTVLALKLAEAQIIMNNTDEKPIILLDDVLSELDEFRRDYVLNKIVGGQVFITCCDRSTVDIQKRGKTFYVENGKICEVN